MTSTFKLTKAEFVKIFKRPSIFIMAILLVVTILASITMFQPSSRVDTTITYDNVENSQGYYDNFYNDAVINSKYTLDEKYTSANDIINYYNAINNNTALLSDYYYGAIELISKMKESNDTVEIRTYRYALETQLENFYDAYQELDSLKDYEEIISPALTQVEYENFKEYGAKNYYTNDACLALTTFLEDVKNTSEINDSELLNIYEKNNYESQLKAVLNNGTNFIYTTLKGMANDIKEFYDYYLQSIRDNAQAYIASVEKWRGNLEKSLKQFYNYYKVLADSEYPIILVNKDTHETIVAKLEEAIEFVKISTADKNNSETHKAIRDNLNTTNVRNYLVSLFKASTSSQDTPIVQATIPVRIVTKLKSYATKTETNRNKIIENINSKKVDESIKNIQKEITNYSLLGVSIKNLAYQRVLTSITSVYDQSTYKNFYGYDFDTFNKFESQEIITKNEYYIDNNIYENSYLNNFSYSQNSGNKTNMYDYAYFAMELCTLIVIIFAMMLVCNLITGETESGTIKLLLVRPYRRSKILTAKLLATIFFVITFMLFSSVLTLVGGYFIYGSVNTPILAIFNGTVAFEISPMGMMALNILSLTLDVIFFVLLALMISVICRNYAGSISCSLVVLIINFAFNFLFNGTFWYTLLPGMNLHLFKYFGNSFLPSSIAGSVAGVIQSLLITGIQTSMSIWFSLIIAGIYSVVFVSISYAVFQKRDF